MGNINVESSPCPEPLEEGELQDSSMDQHPDSGSLGRGNVFERNRHLGIRNLIDSPDPLGLRTAGLGESVDQEDFSVPPPPLGSMPVPVSGPWGNSQFPRNRNRAGRPVLGLNRAGAPRSEAVPLRPEHDGLDIRPRYLLRPANEYVIQPLENISRRTIKRRRSKCRQNRKAHNLPIWYVDDAVGRRGRGRGRGRGNGRGRGSTA